MDLILPLTLWLILFGVGRLDAKEGVPNSGDLYRWFIAPLIFAMLFVTLRLGTSLVTLVDILFGRATQDMLKGDSLVLFTFRDPFTFLFFLLSLTAPLIAYDLGYYSVTGNLRLQAFKLASLAAARQLHRREVQAPPTPVRRVRPRRGLSVRSVGVDERGRLVVRVG